MAYRDFSLKKIQDAFQMQLYESAQIFAEIQPHAISAYLAETLRENVPLAVSINTEKARSELIIAPILVELRKVLDRTVSLFSGIELTVDRAQDLSGFCDFIISNSPEQLFLRAPIITIVEAKNENLMSGLGPCLAEMIAARLFNEREGQVIPTVYGAVTSGNLWKFLKLHNNTAHIDLDDYSIRQPELILGILMAMATQRA
ncbi:MAG: hypothetical protein H6974_11475 [Gammaproteobacteria bacterium]|nr:hypothetical protein [Gammaproteobacteria bacterium]